MRKYLDLLLDLLEIADPQSYTSLAPALETLDAKEQVLIAHRGAFILQGYMELLRGELSPEEFVLLGDVESGRRLYQPQMLTSDALIAQLQQGQFPTEQVVVVDRKAWQVLLSDEEKSQIETVFFQQGKKLLMS